MAKQYQRKTRDLWDILIDYGQGYEVVSCATSLKERSELIRDYIENEGICPKTRKYREKIAS